MKKELVELMGDIAFVAMVVVLCWLYLKATPAQPSGESDWAWEAEGNLK